MNCPLCASDMEQVDSRMVCVGDDRHILLSRETEGFLRGELSYDYIVHRMKIRRAQKMAKRRCLG